MVETICPNCGNRKSFEDFYIGKRFKCPSCSNPVTIQNVGSQLNAEPISQTNSFADEIAQAEAEKKRQVEEARKEARKEANKGKFNTYFFFASLIVVTGEYLISESVIKIGLVCVGVGLWLIIWLNKMKYGLKW